MTPSTGWSAATLPPGQALRACSRLPRRPSPAGDTLDALPAAATHRRAPATRRRRTRTAQFPTRRAGRGGASARAAARDAANLDELGATLARFDGCSLKATAKNLCFYRGAAQARLMLVGEAPGRDEDLEGKPFVGRAGQLLDKMLAAIELTEQDVHITNIVYWRPPGNRTPTPQEAQVCRPFLERQVELVAPEVIVLLGGAAAKHILDVPEGIMSVRGKWRDLKIGAHQVRAHRNTASRLPAAHARRQAAGVARSAGHQGRSGRVKLKSCDA